MAIGGDLIGTAPEAWFLIFEERARSRWLGWVAMGRFKHVQAVGWVRDQRLWVFYDVSLRVTRITVMQDCPDAWRLIRAMRTGSVVVAMAPRQNRRWWWRFGFWCVPAMAHLVGVKGMPLRPDRLFRLCLQQGGQVVTFDQI